MINKIILHYNLPSEFFSELPEIEGGGGEIENLWVLEGDDIDLTCEADAVPPPVITWRRGEDYVRVSCESKLLNLAIATLGCTNLKFALCGVF